MMIASKKPQRLAPAVTEVPIMGQLCNSTKTKIHPFFSSHHQELFDISDMGSLNIQRGRDQGLQPYNVYRPLCGLKRLTSFQDWPGLKIN
jgi:hypothetical protein